jgi:hypothetical protein
MISFEKYFRKALKEGIPTRVNNDGSEEEMKDLWLARQADIRSGGDQQLKTRRILLSFKSATDREYCRK